MRKQPFNLIVTHYPGYDNFVVARSQLHEILEDMRVVDSSQSIMLILVKDPYEAIEKIRSSGLKDTPILRVIPVDNVVDVYVDRIAKSVHELLLSKSKPNESFMIKIDGKVYKYSNGEITRIHRSEAIDIIAKGIDRPVNLSSPDWLVYIKTVRMYRATELAAVTVCRPNQILSFSSRSSG